jgi:hypothetical protein
VDYFNSVLTAINADISRGEALPVEEQLNEGVLTGQLFRELLGNFSEPDDVVRRIPVAQRSEIIPLKAFLGLARGDATGVALAGGDMLGKTASSAELLNRLTNTPALAPASGRIAGDIGGNQ